MGCDPKNDNGSVKKSRSEETRLLSVFPLTDGSSKKKMKKSPSMPVVSETIKTKPDHGFLEAAKTNKIATIELFLNNPYFNPNIQNDFGCTAFICAGIAKDFYIMELLLKDHRIDTSIPNNKGMYAHSYLPTKDELNNMKTDEEAIRRFALIHSKIFVRFSLDCAINDNIKGIKDAYIQGFVDETILNLRIKMILERTSNSEKSQKEEDRKMPDHSLCKIDPDFIKKMILFRLIFPSK